MAEQAATRSHAKPHGVASRLRRHCRPASLRQAVSVTGSLALVFYAKSVALVVAYLHESTVGLGFVRDGFRGAPYLIVSGLLILLRIRRIPASCSLVLLFSGLAMVASIGQQEKAAENRSFRSFSSGG